MKLNNKIINIILMATLIVICNSCICYADNLPTLDNYEPPYQSLGGGAVNEVINHVLGAVIAIGAILITIFIAITGFGMILGSAEEKAVAKEKMSGYLIAAVILTGGATIAKVIISIAEGFGAFG